MHYGLCENGDSFCLYDSETGYKHKTLSSEEGPIF